MGATVYFPLANINVPQVSAMSSTIMAVLPFTSPTNTMLSTSFAFLRCMRVCMCVCVCVHAIVRVCVCVCVCVCAKWESAVATIISEKDGNKSPVLYTPLCG